MSIHVDEAVVQRTTKCPHDFRCLSSGQCGDPEKCMVEATSGEHVIFLSSKEPMACPYRIIFGSRQICQCPTHYAICKSLGK